MFSGKLRELYCMDGDVAINRNSESTEINGNILPPVLRRAKTFHHGVRTLGD